MGVDKIFEGIQDPVYKVEEKGRRPYWAWDKYLGSNQYIHNAFESYEDAWLDLREHLMDRAIYVEKERISKQKIVADFVEKRQQCATV